MSSIFIACLFLCSVFVKINIPNTFFLMIISTNDYEISVTKGRGRKEGRKCFLLTTHSTHFIWSYMVSDILLKPTQITRQKTGIEI